jgi:TMEM175 potassium channel family protein
MMAGMSAESSLPGPGQEASPPAGAAHDDSPPGPERLLALSDGVAAIALTLLVLDLRVPAISLLRQPDSASGLAMQLGKDTDQLISYVVSFYVIAQFWLTHHRVFRGVTGHSEGLAWWNFAFLFCITLVPFASGLLGLYAQNPLAVDIFAANLLLASLVSQATTRFIKRKGLSAAYDEEQARAGRIRSLSVAAIMAVSMAVAWANADLAKYLWILIAFVPDILIRATRRRPGPPSPAPDPG